MTRNWTMFHVLKWSDKAMDTIHEDEHGEIVECAECGDRFDNWENSFFFPAGDEPKMPKKYEDKHYCDACGSVIAKRYGWF